MTFEKVGELMGWHSDRVKIDKLNLLLRWER